MEGKQISLQLDPEYFALLPAGPPQSLTEQTAALIRLALDEHDTNGRVSVPPTFAPKLMTFLGPDTLRRLDALRAAYPDVPYVRVLRALLERRRSRNG